jgi:hypothetical protein
MFCDADQPASEAQNIGTRFHEELDGGTATSSVFSMILQRGKSQMDEGSVRVRVPDRTSSDRFMVRMP